MAAILIIDDDAAFCEGLAETLSDLGHRPVAVQSVSAGAAQMEAAKWALVFLDLRLGRENGLDLLRRWSAEARHDLPPVVILTAYADADNTIEGMKLGAFDHLTKPVGRKQVTDVVARALACRSTPASEAVPAAAQPRLLGNSPVMRELQKNIGLAAATDSTVLITGETGTGKELVARSLHEHGARSARAFVAVNCAAIPGELLESELFGHVKGAFTGAAATRLGRFREAERGTLFLDEVGDMSLPMQAKLLRALQERVVTPVGGATAQPLDVRFIAATHRDLFALIREGRFREDLFYRFNVIPIHVPPLRERGEDVLLLAAHFLALAAAPRAPKRLAREVAEALQHYPWPGNVRELTNLMQRLHAVVRGPVIALPDLPALGLRPAGALPLEWLEMTLPEAIARLEKEKIAHALGQTGGNRAEAARRLQIRRQLLHEKLKQHHLKGPSAEESGPGGAPP